MCLNVFEGYNSDTRLELYNMIFSSYFYIELCQMICIHYFLTFTIWRYQWGDFVYDWMMTLTCMDSEAAGALWLLIFSQFIVIYTHVWLWSCLSLDKWMSESGILFFFFMVEDLRVKIIFYCIESVECPFKRLFTTISDKIIHVTSS